LVVPYRSLLAYSSASPYRSLLAYSSASPYRSLLAYSSAYVSLLVYALASPYRLALVCSLVYALALAYVLQSVCSLGVALAALAAASVAVALSGALAQTPVWQSGRYSQPLGRACGSVSPSYSSRGSVWVSSIGWLVLAMLAWSGFQMGSASRHSLGSHAGQAAYCD
jgi:hypothetical protein